MTTTTAGFSYVAGKKESGHPLLQPAKRTHEWVSAIGSEQYPFQSPCALDADPTATMGPGEDTTMISIYRCHLENDQ
jgi:hypothetical protein